MCHVQPSNFCGNKTFVLDGTSACKKTTILNEVRDQLAEYFGEYPEIVKCKKLERTNTFVPSTIGYMYSGLENVRMPSKQCGGFKLMDRSPLNALEWRLLWKCMDHFVRIDCGNVNALPTQFQLDNYSAMFKHLLASHYYRNLRRDVQGLVIIDSDVKRCDNSRAQRNQKSDKIRSNWLFYTPFQNMMYKTLYPDNYIDLADLTQDSNKTEPENMKSAIEHITNLIVAKCKILNIAPIQPTTYPRYSLPTLQDTDMQYDNSKALVYRELIRMKRAECMNEPRDYKGPFHLHVRYNGNIMMVPPSSDIVSMPL